jgi:hypothetical protein
LPALENSSKIIESKNPPDKIAGVGGRSFWSEAQAVKRVVLVLIVIGLGVGRMVAGPPPCASINGDSNGDGGIDLSDAVYSLVFSFQGGPGPVEFCFAVGPKAPECANVNGDCNGDGDIDLSDAVYGLAFSFQGGPGPLPPCPDASGPEVCDDIFDNDGDGDTDCADADCADALNCLELGCGAPDCCNNGIDDDGDGNTDCFDTECFATEPLCQSTCTEDFADDVFDCGWAEVRDFGDFGGQPDSVVVSGGVATFVKTGIPAHFTYAIGASPGSKIPSPWSVKVTVVDVSDLPTGGGYLIFRFWKPGLPVHDWLSLSHQSGGIIQLSDAGGNLVWSSNAAEVTSLTLKFDVEVSALTASVAADGGAFSAGTQVEWLDTVNELTPLGLYIGAMDLFGVTPGPFSIAIDDLKLTAPPQPEE